MPQLFVLSGPDVGKSFTIRAGDPIGRAPENVVALRHASISRRHAHIERDGDTWFVVDDGSRNGILVEKKRVDRLALADKQEFQIGELLLRFRLADPEGASSSAFARAPRSKTAEPDEIRLEDPDEIRLDDDAPTIVPAAPIEPPPRPSPPREPIVAPRAAPPPPPAPIAAPLADTGFGRGPSNAGATISRSKERAGERILQYHKVENARGVSHTDLAQLSAPVRWLLVVLAIAVLATVAWLAFSGTSFLKERIGGDAGAQDEPADK